MKFVSQTSFTFPGYHKNFIAIQSNKAIQRCLRKCLKFGFRKNKTKDQGSVKCIMKHSLK